MLLDAFNEHVVVMGIDPGIKNCGVAVVYIYPDRETVQVSKTIKVDIKGEWLTELWSLVNDDIPLLVGIEREFIGVNPRDGIQLARNIGKIIHELQLFAQVEVTPQDNNFLLTGRRQKVKDKDKKVSAQALWGSSIDQHQASAVATAVNAFKKYKEELNRYGK